jgi:hypothetical protein
MPSQRTRPAKYAVDVRQGMPNAVGFSNAPLRRPLKNVGGLLRFAPSTKTKLQLGGRWGASQNSTTPHATSTVYES